MYPCPAHGKGKLHASVWDITSTGQAPSRLSVSPPATPIPQSPSLVTSSISSIQTPPLCAPTPLTPAVSSPHSALHLQHPTAIPLVQPPASSFSLPAGIAPTSVDVITVIYVLSALHPIEWEQAIHNLYTVRKFPLLAVSPTDSPTGSQTRWTASDP